MTLVSFDQIAPKTSHAYPAAYSLDAEQSNCGALFAILNFVTILAKIPEGAPKTTPPERGQGTANAAALAAKQVRAATLQ